jgi:hypothetical protein
MSAPAYPPLNVQVHTPRLSLLGETDELLERLVPVVGPVAEPPWPFDDSGPRCGATTSSSSASPDGWRSYVSETVLAEPASAQQRATPA